MGAGCEPSSTELCQRTEECRGSLLPVQTVKDTVGRIAVQAKVRNHW